MSDELEPKGPGGRPAHEPTHESRELVKSLSGYGVTQLDICNILDITKPSLHKHYRREIDLGFAQANARVGESLFRQATEGGNVAAAIFWMKARAGWREKQEIIVESTARELSDAELLAIATGSSEGDDEAEEITPESDRLH